MNTVCSLRDEYTFVQSLSWKHYYLLGLIAVEWVFIACYPVLLLYFVFRIFHLIWRNLFVYYCKRFCPGCLFSFNHFIVCCDLQDFIFIFRKGLVIKPFHISRFCWLINFIQCGCILCVFILGLGGTGTWWTLREMEVHKQEGHRPVGGEPGKVSLDLPAWLKGWIGLR